MPIMMPRPVLPMPVPILPPGHPRVQALTIPQVLPCTPLVLPFAPPSPSIAASQPPPQAASTPTPTHIGTHSQSQAHPHLQPHLHDRPHNHVHETPVDPSYPHAALCAAATTSQPTNHIASQPHPHPPSTAAHSHPQVPHDAVHDVSLVGRTILAQHTHREQQDRQNGHTAGQREPVERSSTALALAPRTSLLSPEVVSQSFDSRRNRDEQIAVYPPPAASSSPVGAWAGLLHHAPEIIAQSGPSTRPRPVSRQTFSLVPAYYPAVHFSP